MRKATGSWALLLIAACSAPLDPAVPQTEGPVTSRTASGPEAASPPPCRQIAAIEVWKSQRLLRARCVGGAIVEITAALGREPGGDKLLSGDLRTPEGRYRIVDTPRASRFHAFVPINYPSPEDADRALADGRIDMHDHARIRRAHEEGVTPPDDTPLGGGIGFHGEGERWAGDSRYLDWTLGCIAVSDAEIDFLIERIHPGVPVEIRP